MAKTLIVYSSIHHGNTEKIASVMSSVLKASCVKPDKVNPDIFSKYNLIGFGSGIYFSMHHESIFNLLDKINKPVGKKAFIFSTSGSWNIRFLNDFNAPLRKKLESKGFETIGDFNCRGYDTVGPLKHIGGLNRNRPNEKDMEKARVFAENLELVIEALK